MNTYSRRMLVPCLARVGHTAAEDTPSAGPGPNIAFADGRAASFFQWPWVKSENFTVHFSLGAEARLVDWRGHEAARRHSISGATTFRMTREGESALMK